MLRIERPDIRRETTGDSITKMNTLVNPSWRTRAFPNKHFHPYPSTLPESKPDSLLISRSRNTAKMMHPHPNYHDASVHYIGGMLKKSSVITDTVGAIAGRWNTRKILLYKHSRRSPLTCTRYIDPSLCPFLLLRKRRTRPYGY